MGSEVRQGDHQREEDVEGVMSLKDGEVVQKGETEVVNTIEA